MPYMQLRRVKGNCGGDAELICLLEGRSHVWWGERRHKVQPAVRGEIGSMIVTEKTEMEVRMSECIDFHNRRKGEKDARFNEGKFGRGEKAARGIRIATPKRIFWGRLWSVLPVIAGIRFRNGVLDY